MFGNQRHHAAHPNQGFYHPHGNANFRQRNQHFQLNHPGMNPNHHPAYPPQRNPNWGPQNHRVPLNPAQHPAYPPQRNPNWGPQNHRVPLNPPHHQAYPPQRNPNWGPQNHHVPLNPPHHQAYAPQRHPNRGYQNWNAPFNPIPPPPSHHRNWNVPVNPATGGNPSYPTAPDRSLDQGASNHPVHSEPASTPQETKIEDPPAPALDTKQDVEQKDYRTLFNPNALPFIPRAVEVREIVKQFTPVESTQSVNQCPQPEVQDANPANVFASEDMTSTTDVNNIKKEITELRNQMQEKDKRLSELKEEREMGKRRLQSQQAELEAKKNHLKKETQFKEKCGLRAAALRDKLERLQQAAKAKQASEDRKTEAHTLALEKLAMLKKELLEKRNYNLELTQRLKMEEEEKAEPEVLKDQMEAEEITISAPLSEPEVVKDQVQDEEITISVPPSEPEEVSKQIELALDKLATLHKELLEKRNYKLELTQRLEMEKKAGPEVVKDQVQDEEITISSPLSEPEEVLKQTEAEKTDAFIAPQMENEDSESGHHLREQPDALPSVETKKKKRSLWKRFKSFFTPRHRQKNKPKA